MTGGADVAVTKTHTPAQVALYTPLTYTLTVVNHGPLPATGVTLVDQLPAGVSVLSLCTSQGKCCRHCASEITCQLGTLAAHQTAVVRITVKPCQTGTLTNTAIVTANEDDQYPTNNQAVDTVTVVTWSEQAGYLSGRITELVTAHILTAEKAEWLITTLRNAQQAINCGSMTNANYYLHYFIEAVNNYISQDILDLDTGCPLIQIAEALRQQLGCKPDYGQQGDEHREQPGQ